METLSAPDNNAWDAWFDGPAASPDFMQDREQPAQDERETTPGPAPEDGKQP